MGYDPNKHHRKSIRLKGYDYSQAGLYFITICVQDRKHLFGKIIDGTMILNDFGTVAHQQWQKLQERFTNMKLDVFQIMPNHMHGIIVGAGFTPAPNDAIDQNDIHVQNDMVVQNVIPAQINIPVIDANPMAHIGAGASPVPTAPTAVGDIVGAYKSLVANNCLEIFKQKYPGKMMGKLWQRNYYEHIIRDEQAYHRISEYIINNPKKWKEDKFNK
jgi:putative transposase